MEFFENLFDLSRECVEIFGEVDAVVGLFCSSPLKFLVTLGSIFLFVSCYLFLCFWSSLIHCVWCCFTVQEPLHS